MNDSAPGARLRVLVDATALPADRGGVGRYVDALVEALAALGVPVAVIAQARDAQRFAELVGPSRAQQAPSWAARTPLRLAWEQAGLPAHLRSFRPDVLLSPHYTVPLANRGRRRTAQVVTMHDLTFFSHPELHSRAKTRFFSRWIRLSARVADAVVVPSDATRRELVALAGADPSRVWVVPHGVDQARFRPPTPSEVAAARTWAGLPPDSPHVAFLGTLEPRKNVPALVGAYVDACRSRAQPPALVLAGGAGWDTAIDTAIDAVPSRLTVRRPGFVPDDLVAGLLGGAEVVAYPSLGEGFGLPVLEAMACGAPVLTTRMLSLPEVGGEAVAYADTPARLDLAAALTALLDSPRRRAELGVLGLARAATFTWEAAARGHLAVFEQAVECARGGVRL
ncbi:MAG: glycosyltransferase family 4 protein [Dermatophilaceae bacterium]